MYNPQKIELKWQKYWQEQKLFEAKNFSKRKKLYLLVEFPYPSGEGLHVGHCRSYTAMDIIARKRRMEGFNVLFPMGWDAFGLPTENYALKTGTHPKIVTAKNTVNFKRQLKSLGLSFDWSREINTTDPEYYKWTQWIFLKFFEKGLCYKTKMPVNWCPSCKIVLSNEEVIEGCCERCGKIVERREKEQWLLKITKYAERLLKDLDKVNYPEKVKTLQKDWIGKSIGAEIKFPISNTQHQVSVFTTRLDTIFGATYLVVSPEHPFVASLLKIKDKKLKIKNKKKVEAYIKKSKEKTERERISEIKEKSGIKLEGITAINPAIQKEIPVFIADYVLMSYGTGAIMAVPAHDERDFDFAKKYKLPIKQVIVKNKNLKSKTEKLPIIEDGVLVNSGKFSGLKSETARKKITEFLEKKDLVKTKVCYKLRDWIFSRQHYWGEPIPLVFCKNCGWVPVPEKDLPVKLPEIKDYKPTEKGESPLAKAKKWLSVKCPKCGLPAKRETDTMPNWAGSNWYFLRYCDPKNEKSFVSKKLLEYWLPVDWYNGGMEHTTLHLLYSRFCYKVLYDLGLVPADEPYKKRTSHGMILGDGGIKMSKSKGNVINPDTIVKEEGADTLRIYEMFMGPFAQATSWDKKGINGTRRFLDKVWQLSNQFISINPSESAKISGLKKELYRTIKKVSEDIENLKFNTAVSSMMKFCNLWSRLQSNRGFSTKSGQKNSGALEVNDFENFLKILSPFAPHLAEEIWSSLSKISKNKQYKKSIFLQSWPKYDKKIIKEKKFLLIVQVNGKVRDKIEIEIGAEKEEAKKIAQSSKKIEKRIGGKSIKKIIFIPNKLINFVI